MNVSITRRRLLAAGVAASSLALSGCFTPKLYKEDGYSEHVSGFMMTEDGKKLVVRHGLPLHLRSAGAVAAGLDVQLP